MICSSNAYKPVGPLVCLALWETLWQQNCDSDNDEKCYSCLAILWMLMGTTGPEVVQTLYSVLRLLKNGTSYSCCFLLCTVLSGIKKLSADLTKCYWIIKMLMLLESEMCCTVGFESEITVCWSRVIKLLKLKSCKYGS